MTSVEQRSDPEADRAGPAAATRCRSAPAADCRRCPEWLAGAVQPSGRRDQGPPLLREDFEDLSELGEEAAGLHPQQAYRGADGGRRQVVPDASMPRMVRMADPARTSTAVITIQFR